jgi:hypothetical protein
MTSAQYTHLLSVISDVAQDVQSFQGLRSLPARMNQLEDAFHDLRKEMRDGFAALHEADQEILSVIGEAYQDHEHRIVRLEKAAAIK